MENYLLNAVFLLVDEYLSVLFYFEFSTDILQIVICFVKRMQIEPITMTE